VRSQLQQELSLKREAFQQVNRLQDQVTDLGAAATAGTEQRRAAPHGPLHTGRSTRTSSSNYRFHKRFKYIDLTFPFTGPSRSDYNPSVSRWRTTGPSAGTAASPVPESHLHLR